jgi:hypothetical protein
MNRPYECQIKTCDKKFTTRFSLRRHLATHQESKQFVCVICFKKFALGQYLKEHTYIHTGQKPFRCTHPGCSKAFRQAGKLSMHKKIHQNKIFIVQKIKKRGALLTLKPIGQERIQNSQLRTLVLKEKEFRIDLHNDHSIPAMESSTASNDQIMLYNNHCSSKGENSPLSYACGNSGMKQTNFNQLHSHFDMSTSSTSNSSNQQNFPNETLINQLVNKLSYPEMVIRRMLPLPENMFSYKQ